MIFILCNLIFAQEPTDSNDTPETSSKEETDVEKKDVEEKDVEEKDVEENDIEKKDVEEKDVEENDIEEKDVEEKDVEEKDVEEKAESIEETPTIKSSILEKSEPNPTDSITESFKGTVELINGDRLHGMIYLYSDGSVTVRLDSVGEVDLSKDAVKELIPQKGEFNVIDQGMPRYFYAPTAMPLEPESGYLSQKELLFSAVAYSPTQNWSFLVGSSIPVLLYSIAYMDSDAMIGVLGLRYGKQIDEDVYVGGGVETFIVPDGNFTLPFVNTTFGDHEQHVTFSTGVGISDFDNAEFVPLNVSIYKRITHSLALVTENWLIVRPTQNYIYEQNRTVYNWNQRNADLFFSAVGIRFISPKFSTDVAIINSFLEGDYLPLPWLDVTWYFDSHSK
jgi:hypothetical protein